MSGQGTSDPERGLEEQRELARRLALPFDLLNVSRFELVHALKLPTFQVRLRAPTFEFRGSTHRFVLEGQWLVKRLAFLAEESRIRKVFYPIFPPDRSAAVVRDFLKALAGDIPRPR